MVLCIHFPFSVYAGTDPVSSGLDLFMSCAYSSSVYHQSCCVCMTVLEEESYTTSTSSLCSPESPKVSDYASFGVFSSQYSTYVPSCSCLKFLKLTQQFLLCLWTLCSHSDFISISMSPSEMADTTNLLNRLCVCVCV